MDISQCISPECVIELDCDTFEESIKKLLLSGEFNGQVDDLVNKLVQKEAESPSSIGNGILVPNFRANISQKIKIFIGRCQKGIDIPFSQDHDTNSIVVLVLVSDKEQNYLNIISSIVNVLQKPQNVEIISNVEDFETFKSNILSVFGAQFEKSRKRKAVPNELLLKEVIKISHESKCSGIMLIGNVNLDYIDTEELFNGIKVVQVVHDKCPENPIVDDLHLSLKIKTSVDVCGWTHRFRGIILLGVTQKVIYPDEKLCCVGSNQESGVIDTILITEVQNELGPIFGINSKISQDDIKPEVLERVVSIASELATEGREGKPVGCLFVIGDINKISLFMKPLVLNPFFGYKESERNILSMPMDETIKEYSLIDGAIVISGDGIVESAGTLIYTPDHNIVMPAGYGTRHAAAASISWAAECISVVVSESTRTVTLFRNGKMLQL